MSTFRWHVSQRGWGERDIRLELAPAAAKWLGVHGYDPVYGARPLKRVIQRYLENVLATQVLRGDIEAGASVKVDADKDGLVINGQSIKAEAA